MDLATDLVADSKRIAAKVPSPTEPGSPASPSAAQPRVPQRLQRTKIADAMKMVEREYVPFTSFVCLLHLLTVLSLRSAVIESITARLERLNTSV